MLDRNTVRRITAYNALNSNWINWANEQYVIPTTTLDSICNFHVTAAVI